MAIFHLSAVIHSRGKGHSSVNGAAYRARDAFTDERTGARHDYSRKSADVLFAGIYAPKDAPEWTRDRAQLWNHVEAFEKRRDAQLARVFDIALPHELTLEQNRRLLQDWVRDNFMRKGLIADAVIHAPDRKGDTRNVHAHVAVVMRKLDGTEFAARKERTETNAERIGQLEGWRASWEKLANRHLERAGLDVRIDRRTLKEQGIDAEPTKHIGPTATTMDRRGAFSDRGAVNHEITQRNAERQKIAALEAEQRKLTAQIIDLKAEREAREAQAAGERRRYDNLRETHRQVARDQFHGKYDELTAATPPPEIVRQFETNASHTAEPAAPIFDRDAAEAAWTEKLQDAAIKHAEAERDIGNPGREGEALRQPEEAISTYQPASENAPEVTATRPIVAPEPEIAATPASDLKSPERVATGFFGRFTKTFENIVGGLLGFFEGSEAKLSPQQAELAAKAAQERAEANAAAIPDREADARYALLAEQQRSRDIARTLQIDTVGDPEEERFRSIMQRSARENERDREHERER